MTLAGPAKNAPMASAPLKFRSDGAVDWGNMWDTFCALAQDGGPPHRGEMLTAAAAIDIENPTYVEMAREIIRGVTEVSGLAATTDEPGWIAISCHSTGMARWLQDAIVAEKVEARCREATLLVPVSANYTILHEVKNIITVVAKSTHYWDEHLRREVKQSLSGEPIPQTRVWPTRWIGRGR